MGVEIEAEVEAREKVMNVILKVGVGVEVEVEVEEINIGKEIEKEVSIEVEGVNIQETEMMIGTEIGIEKGVNIEETGIETGIEKGHHQTIGTEGMNHQNIAANQGPRQASQSTVWDTTMGTSKAVEDSNLCQDSQCTMSGSSPTGTKSLLI